MLLRMDGGGTIRTVSSLANVQYKASEAAAASRAIDPASLSNAVFAFPAAFLAKLRIHRLSQLRHGTSIHPHSGLVSCARSQASRSVDVTIAHDIAKGERHWWYSTYRLLHMDSCQFRSVPSSVSHLFGVFCLNMALQVISFVWHVFNTLRRKSHSR